MGYLQDRLRETEAGQVNPVGGAEDFSFLDEIDYSFLDTSEPAPFEPEQVPTPEFDDPTPRITQMLKEKGVPQLEASAAMGGISPELFEQRQQERIKQQEQEFAPTEQMAEEPSFGGDELMERGKGFGYYGLSSEEKSAFIREEARRNKEQGFTSPIESLEAAIESFGEKTEGIWEKNEKRVRDTQARYESGEIGYGEAVWRDWGAVGLGIVETLGEGALETAKALLPKSAEDWTEEKVGEGIQAIWDTARPEAKEQLVELANKWKKIEEEDPNLAANLRPFLFIADMIATFAGGGVVKKGLGKVDIPTTSLTGDLLGIAKEGVAEGGALLSGVKEGAKGLIPDIKVPKFKKNKDIKDFVKNVPKAQEITMADKLSNSLNKIDPVAGQQKFQQMTGQSAGEWLNDRGFVGNREQNVTDLAKYWEKSKAKVDKALRIPKEKFKSPEFGEAIAIVEKELGKRSRDRPKFEKLQKSYDEGGLTLSQENELKRIYERNVALSHKKDLTKSAKSKRDATDLDNALREGVISRAETLGIKDIRALNKETQSAKHLADQIAGKALKQASNNTMSLTDNILFSGAGVAGAINPAFLAGYGALKLTKSEWAHSLVIKLLNKRTLKTMPEPDFKKIEAAAKRRQARASQPQAGISDQTLGKPEIEVGKSTPRQIKQELPESEKGLLNGSSPENLAEKARKVNLENKSEFLKSPENLKKKGKISFENAEVPAFKQASELLKKTTNKELASMTASQAIREGVDLESISKQMKTTIEKAWEAVKEFLTAKNKGSVQLDKIVPFAGKIEKAKIDLNPNREYTNAFFKKNNINNYQKEGQAIIQEYAEMTTPQLKNLRKDKNKLKKLEEVANKWSMPSDEVIYRGLSRNISNDLIKLINNGTLKINDNVFLDNVSSTSLSPSVADRFSEGVLLKINAPKGTRAIPIGDVFDEKEILLVGNKKIRINDITKLDNNKILITTTLE